MDWDDLKVLLALSRKGSARGAAQQLGVSNSTITRRLDDMEHQLHTRLFDRTPDGYRLTGAGEQILPTAEHVEELILVAERQISGGDQELEGSIRLTLPPAGRMGFLVRHLARFAEDYPRIELELEASNDALDLSRREADIAIRVMRMAAISASSYVHRDLLNSDKPEDVSHINWIGKYPEGRKEEWLVNTGHPENTVRHAILEISLILESVRSKMGMAFMPCFSVYRDPDIVRVPGAPVVHQSDMWVLTHKDLRLSARMRVLREIIAEAFGEVRAELDSREG
jgi:DNA-binding transcriptional LysR family regulator